MNAAKTTDVARILMEEHERGVKFRRFALESGVDTIDLAYATQNDFVRLQKAARGVEAIGYKMGLTSPRMQEMCGIDQPISGVVLSDRKHLSGAALRPSTYGRLGLEFEIAVRVGRDIESAERLGLGDIAAAVDGICPAFEIVDDRGCDYVDLEVFSLIADNAWNAGVVLSPFQPATLDLATVAGIVSVDGSIVDKGHGRDVLGHPFHSVAWLAQRLSLAGDKLRAGDIVMTGNLVTTKFPTAPCDYRFEVPGLGAVEVMIRE
jgi:2-keto-4-pentenoate hydratase